MISSMSNKLQEAELAQAQRLAAPVRIFSVEQHLHLRPIIMSTTTTQGQCLLVFPEEEEQPLAVPAEGVSEQRKTHLRLKVPKLL